METFEHLRRSRLVLLTTRGSGDVAVHRPVRMSVDAAGNGFVWVRKGLALAARLEACPEVRVAPCDLRFRPTGSDQPAMAQRCDRRPYDEGGDGSGIPAPADHDRATVIARETGLAALLDRLRRSLICYRLTPADEPTPWQQRVGRSSLPLTERPVQ